MTQNFAGEIVLVTGASRGIGAAIADTLAARGATVVGTATSEAGAAAIGERLSAWGGAGRMLDVTDGAAVEALVDAIGTEFGPVSILVNNAGITRDQLLMRMKDEDWNAILDTNLSSVFRTSKAVLRGMMKARKGRIISIASVIGLTGNAGQANYAAAKAGIIAFSKSRAKEIGSRGITRCRNRRRTPCRARSPSAASVPPATSPRRSPSWPARPPPMSPARPCTSTGACTWPEP